ncbi:MAG: hypothetical protein ACHQQQ_04175 [Bacteroidota bacterium]
MKRTLDYHHNQWAYLMAKSFTLLLSLAFILTSNMYAGKVNRSPYLTYPFPSGTAPTGFHGIRNGEANCMNFPLSEIGGCQLDPRIAVSKEDPSSIMVVWTDYLDGMPHLGYAFTNSESGKWTRGKISLIEKGKEKCAAEVSIVADNSNPKTFYIAFLAWNVDSSRNNISNCSVYSGVTTDAGQDWDFNNITPDSSKIKEHPSIAIDYSSEDTRGTLYVVWADESKGAIVITKSTDQGKKWLLPPLVIGGENDTLVELSFPVVATNSGGVIFVSWAESDEGTGSIRYVRSKGWNFSFYSESPIPGISTFVQDTIRCNPYLATSPVLSCSPVSGNLYVAWNNKFTDKGIPMSEVLFKCSTNMGISWKETDTIGRTATGPFFDVFNPTITCDDSGKKVTIAYYDTREDPEYHIQFNVKCVTALQRDRKFSQPISISDYSSLIYPDTFYIGEHLSIAYSSNLLYCAWADTRENSNKSGPSDIYAAIIPERDLMPRQPPPPPSISYNDSITVTIRATGNVQKTLSQSSSGDIGNSGSLGLLIDHSYIKDRPNWKLDAMIALAANNDTTVSDFGSDVLLPPKNTTAFELKGRWYFPSSCFNLATNLRATSGYWRHIRVDTLDSLNMKPVGVSHFSWFLGVSYDVFHRVDLDNLDQNDNNKFTCIFDVGYTLRHLSGDISLEPNDNLRTTLLKSKSTTFNGFEIGVTLGTKSTTLSFRACNMPTGFIFENDQIPGLSGWQFIGDFIFNADIVSVVRHFKGGI